MNKIKPVPSFVLTIDWFKNFAQIHSFSITLWNSFLKITISLHELSSVFTIFSYFYGQLPKSVETKFVSRRIRVRFFLFVNWITSSDVTDSKFLFIKFHTVSAVKKKGRFQANRWWSLMRLSLCVWTAGWICVTIIWVPRERTPFVSGDFEQHQLGGSYSYNKAKTLCDTVLDNLTTINLSAGLNIKTCTANLET